VTTVDGVTGCGSGWGGGRNGMEMEMKAEAGDNEPGEK
jgi:hypothetical protein